MVLTIGEQTISVSPVDEPVVRQTGTLVMSGRPFGAGWTTDQPWFYTLDKDSHLYSLGNGFGVAGNGVGSEAYMYPEQKPDRGRGLSTLSDDERTSFPYCYLGTGINRWSMAISDLMELHDDGIRIGGPQRRFVQVLNSPWPFSGASRLIMTHGFMTVMGSMTQDAAVVELADGDAHDVAVAMFNPSTVPTPTALIYNDTGTLYVQACSFPRSNVESINYTFYDHPATVTLGPSQIIAQGLPANATDGYRGVEAVSLGDNRVLVVAVAADGTVIGIILTYSNGTITAQDTPLTTGAVSLQGLVRHDENQDVLIPVQQGASVEILRVNTEGNTPTVTATRTIGSAAKGWVTWCDNTPICSTLTAGGLATVRSLNAGLADIATVNPNTVTWEYAALYGRPDGRLLVAGSGDGVEGTTPPGEFWDSILEGAWQMFHIDDGAFTLVDQIVPSAVLSSSRRGDHVVPIDDDTVVINTPLDTGAIVSLAGIFHATWTATMFEWDDSRVIECNASVAGGDWISPANDVYLSMRVLEFNSRGVPTRVTRRAVPLVQNNFFPAAVPISDNRFLLACVGEPDTPSTGTQGNYLQVWEVTDGFELTKISQITWSPAVMHSNPWMVVLADGRIAYAARYDSTRFILALIAIEDGAPAVITSELVTPANGTGNSSFNELHPYRLFLVADNTLVFFYETASVGTAVHKITVTGNTFTVGPVALAGKLGNVGARDNHPCQIGSSIYHVVKYTGFGLAAAWGVPDPGTSIFTLLTHIVRIDLDDNAPGGLNGTLLSPNLAAMPPSVDTEIEALRQLGHVEGFNDAVIVPLDDNQLAMLGGACVSTMGFSPMVATRWWLHDNTFEYVEGSETAYTATDRESYPWNGVKLGDGKACFISGLGHMYARGAASGYSENAFAGTVRVLTPRAARGTAVPGPQDVRVSSEGKDF